MKSSTETLIKALEVLAQGIESSDGVANAAIAEAAERLRELSAQAIAEQYLQALAELFRVSVDNYDNVMCRHLAAFLELSLSPEKQLVYWLTNKASMTAGSANMTVSVIENYLAEKVKQ